MLVAAWMELIKNWKTFHVRCLVVKAMAKNQAMKLTFNIKLAKVMGYCAKWNLFAAYMKECQSNFAMLLLQTLTLTYKRQIRIESKT